MIQLQGYSPEPLSGIRCDVHTSTGQITDRQGFVVDQHFDSKQWKFTTNYFRCNDIALAEGSNTITLKATDLAGNIGVATCVYTFSTNGDSTPPVIEVAWPEDKTDVCGSKLTVRGRLDDPTARLVASVTNTNGVMEGIQGLVSRYGEFWVEDLELGAGKNLITLTATDAAGNQATTNLILFQTDAAFTMNPIPESELHQLEVTVTGTVGNPKSPVWVNGVPATVDKSGFWKVTVPVPQGGTADFYARAYPPGWEPPAGYQGSPGNPSPTNTLGIDESKIGGH